MSCLAASPSMRPATCTSRPLASHWTGPSSARFGTVVEAIAADYSRFLYRFQFQTDSFEPIALAVDRAGAVYVTGIVTASGHHFPTTPGVFQPTAPARLARRGGQGRARRVAGLCDVLRQRQHFPVTRSRSIASGNAYITGTPALDCPRSMLVQPDLAGGETDAFVARLNATASALVFSTYLGGGGGDAGRRDRARRLGQHLPRRRDVVSGFPPTECAAAAVRAGAVELRRRDDARRSLARLLDLLRRRPDDGHRAACDRERHRVSHRQDHVGELPDRPTVSGGVRRWPQ